MFSKLKHCKASMPAMHVNGSFRPDTFDAEKRTVEVVFTTGQSGKRYDWYNDIEYNEVLDVTPESIRTERLDKGMSVIDNHNSCEGIDGVFGITEEYRIEDGSIIGSIRFATDAESEIKMQKVGDGILRHVSLGYKIHKYLKTRGEQDKIHTYTAVDWEPVELSFTSVSFETTNGVRAEQRTNEPTNYVEIVNVEEKNMLSKKQLARLALLQGMQSRSDDEFHESNNLLEIQQRSVETPEQRGEASAARADHLAASAARADHLAAAAATPAVDATEVRAALPTMLDAVRSAGLQDNFAIEAFSRGDNVDAFRATVIEELGKESSTNVIKNQGVSLHSDNRSDGKEQVNRAAEDYLIHRCGQDVGDDSNFRDFTGLSLYDMSREFVVAAGEDVKGLSRQRIASRAFHSTSDFPLILENVMNKNLQTAYTETPQTFRDLGSRTTVNDFRAKNTYSLGDAPNLLPLGEHGEYKAGTFSEGKESYSIATYARKIGFTRQMLINDDMSALDRMPAMFGSAGSRLESNIVWGLLLGWDFFNNKAAPNVNKMADGKNLFHADHNNLLASAGLLNKTGLSNLRKQGRKIKTLDDNYMNMTFNTIVVPEDLETDAEDVLVNIIVANEVAKTNQFRGSYNFRVEPRLSAVTGGTLAWYAFSAMTQAFEYAYLAGEEEMMTEVITSTDVDGLEVKVRKDFGAGLVDHRGIAKSNGTA